MRPRAACRGRIASMKGVVAAGHPLTAEAGVDVLRAGGNAVDAAVACVLMSFVAESPLTGPGAGGFMLVHTGRGRGPPARLLRGRARARARRSARRRISCRSTSTSPRTPCSASTSGPSSCGAYGTPVGLAEALARFGTMPLADLTAGPARRRPRGGRGDAHAGLPVRGAGADPALHARVRGDLRARGALLRAGRDDPAARAGRPARAPRRRGPGLPLRGRAGRPLSGVGAGARRAAPGEDLAATGWRSASPRA